MAAKTTHNPDISITIYLAALGAAVAGFGNVLLIVEQATNSLNGDRVLTITSYDDAVTANTAGYISSTTLAAAAAAFTQSPKPAALKFGRADLVGGETYATALTAIIAFDDDFYGVCIQSRDQATVVAVATLIEASSKRMLFAFQDNDVSWYDSGVPAGFAAIDEYERSLPVYHTDDSAWADLAWLVNRLTFDPDFISCPWHACSLASVADLDPMPSAAERLQIIANNCNLGLPYGGADYVMDPGCNIKGRAVYEILTADWYATRLQERTAALVVAHSNRGEKIIVDKSGQKKLMAILLGLNMQGEQAGHFASGQTSATPEAITSADLTAKRLRLTVRNQDAVAARLFNYSIYFSTDPITS